MRKISGNANIRFAVDDDMTGTTIPSSAFSHDGEPGLVRTGAGAADGGCAGRLHVANGKALPPNSTLCGRARSLRPTPAITGSICRPWAPTRSSNSTASACAAPALLREACMATFCRPTRTTLSPPPIGFDNVRRAVDLTAGPHEIEISTSPDSSNAPVQVRLNWYTPEQRKADHEAAIAAAKSAKVAVVFVWTRLEPVFGLPGDQNKLVEEIAAVNPNTIVVLNTSQPVALPWVEQGEGGARNVVAGRRRRMVDGQSSARRSRALRGDCLSPGASGLKTTRPPIPNIPSAQRRASTTRPLTAKA